MNKFTIVGCVSLFALMLAGFGPNPWRAPTEVTASISIAPSALTLSAGAIPLASAADTF
jgi:hypothetical protein